MSEGHFVAYSADYLEAIKVAMSRDRKAEARKLGGRVMVLVNPEHTQAYISGQLFKKERGCNYVGANGVRMDRNNKNTLYKLGVDIESAENDLSYPALGTPPVTLEQAAVLIKPGEYVCDSYNPAPYKRKCQTCQQSKLKHLRNK